MKRKRCVLVTNLSQVLVGSIRVNAHALLLQDNADDADGSRYRARMFGVNAYQELGDIFYLPSIDYTYEVDPVPDWVASMGARVLSTKGTLTVHPPADQDAQVVIKLDCGSIDGRAIDFERHEVTPETIGRLWARLEAKVAHYWHAPYISIPRKCSIDEWQRATRGAL